MSQTEGTDNLSTDPSLLRDYVTTGDEFWFGVSGAQGINGQASFGFQFDEQLTAPGNDLFAARTAINGDTGEVVILVDQASFEIGEPQAPHFEGRAIGSVWWSYTAEQDGWLQIEPIFETNVGISVFQGDSIDQLTPVGANELPNKENSSFEEGLTFEVENGQTYAIAVIVPQDKAPGFQADFTYEVLTAPEVYATEDSFVPEGDSVYLAAADTVDGYQYQWSVATNDIVFSPVGGGVSFIAPEVDVNGQTYEFTLIVTNENDISTTTSMLVHVQNVDQLPIAVAGVDTLFANGAVSYTHLTLPTKA